MTNGSDVKRHIQRTLEQVQVKLPHYKVNEYKTWWTTVEQKGDKFDFSTASENILNIVCILSRSCLSASLRSIWLHVTYFAFI